MLVFQCSSQLSSSRMCDLGHLLQGDIPQALKSLFNWQDDEVWMLEGPRCGDLPRCKEELAVTALLPDTACLLETLEHAPVPGNGDHRGFRREAKKTVWRERHFDPGSCHQALGDNLSRSVHDDRVVERIWSTPGVEGVALQDHLMDGGTQGQPPAEEVAELVVLGFRLKHSLHPLTRTVQGLGERIERNWCCALDKHVPQVVDHFPFKRCFWLDESRFHALKHGC